MKKYGERKTKVLTDVVCDMCGKSCKHADEITGNINYAELIAEWGYGAKHDMETVEIDLCEDCCYKLKDIIEKNPKIKTEKK